MDLPNQDQVISAARWLVTTAGGYAIGRGWINAEQVTMVGGVVAAIVPLVFSFLAHTDKAKLKAVEALPDVKQIVVKPTATNGIADAAADPSRPKITTST